MHRNEIVALSTPPFGLHLSLYSNGHHYLVLSFHVFLNISDIDYVQADYVCYRLANAGLQSPDVLLYPNRANP